MHTNIIFAQSITYSLKKGASVNQRRLREMPVQIYQGHLGTKGSQLSLKKREEQ